MSSASTPVSAPPKPQTGAGCLRVFFLVFFATGCFLLYLIAIDPIWNIWQARSWTPVPCTILSNEVKSSRGGRGTKYHIHIEYTYQVEGRVFNAERYDFDNWITTGGYAGKQEIVDRYPSGSQATCFVNPADPQEAVLHRGPTRSLWWGLFPLPFIAIGLIAFLPARYLSNQAYQGGHLRSTNKVPQKGSSREDQEIHPHDERSGPVELKASVSPTGKLLGLIFVALFWNGIVSVFVGIAWQGISRGRPEWFLILFLIPFLLIGLGLIGGVVHAFLNLFNPRISLLVSSRAVSLGDPLTVEWSFKGNYRRIRDMRIVLEGAERATYRRGTNTATDENIFTKITLVETTDPAQIQTGKKRVTIPGNVMHTFKAPNNEVVWKLKVNGSIPPVPGRCR